MTDTAAFLYDGDCAFCTRCVMFLARHLRSTARIVAWQAADLDSLGVSEDDCTAAVQWVASGRAHAGPAAFAHLLRSATRRRDLAWRIVGRLLALGPVLAAAWPVYQLVARHRHRLPGGASGCALPSRREPQPLESQRRCRDLWLLAPISRLSAVLDVHRAILPISGQRAGGVSLSPSEGSSLSLVIKRSPHRRVPGC